jgi:hypothetical protein
VREWAMGPLALWTNFALKTVEEILFSFYFLVFLYASNYYLIL